MKKIKYALAAAVVMMICVMLLIGCTNPKSNSANSSIASSNGMQPGAKVHQYVDEYGNKASSYTNPDGSGGGSVEIN